ncbi:MAG: hypothetical protein KBT01_03555 [Clostridiales bacterium]|nr:hypothetical protein [Candidatus Blautia equi]
MDSKLLAVQGSDEICFVEKGEEADRFTVLSAETGEALFQGDAPKGSLASCIADDENVYILCYNFNDSLEGAETLTAFDRETGFVKWMRENKGMILGELHYSEGDGVKRLAVTYRAMAWLLDAETGADLRWYNIETPVRYTVTDGLGGFYFYNADGEQVSFNERSDSMVLDIKFIDCEDLMALNRTAGYFVGVPENDNRILGYGIRKNGAAEVIDGNIPDCEQQGLYMEKDIRNWCEAHNVPMDFSIRSLLELEDEDLTFTNCKDQTLKVYRTSTMEMLSSMEWKNSGILRYWGTKDDLLYIEDGAMTGMAFDRDGNLWTEIPEFCGLTEDKENVIIYGRDENAANAYLTIPLYSLEGVMEKAQTLMNRE